MDTRYIYVFNFYSNDESEDDDDYHDNYLRDFTREGYGKVEDLTRLLQCNYPRDADISLQSIFKSFYASELVDKPRPGTVYVVYHMDDIVSNNPALRSRFDEMIGEKVQE